MELQKFEISDSKLEVRGHDSSVVLHSPYLTCESKHNGWKFPSTIKCYPFRADDEDDISFLVSHKVGCGIGANLEDQVKLPFKPDILKVVKEQGWIGADYEHLWRRDGAFLLQTPRDGHSFCSLSLVNRERTYCGGVFIADKQNFNLNKLLAGQPYQNRHPKVPRDFAILPFSVLAAHIEETLSYVQKLSREITSTEKRIAEGSINVDDNGDYKLLNRLNNEHIRLQRRSNFEIEFGKNLLTYIEEYHKMWYQLWEGGTSYIEDMKEKIDQQMRYSEQLKLDLEVIPKRIKNQSKARQQTQHPARGELQKDRGRVQARQSPELGDGGQHSVCSRRNKTRLRRDEDHRGADSDVPSRDGRGVILQHEHVYLARPGRWNHSIATALGIFRDHGPTHGDRFHCLDHVVQILAEKVQGEPYKSCR
nr:hypothetical protein CFP56_73788 [Quercus suber]